MKITALVPIKHHSERVPEKNFRILGQRPLWRWIVDALLDVPAIHKVVINTDSPLIEPGPGWEVRPRKPDIRGDFVSMNDVIADDVLATDSEVYLQTHATNPFISGETIWDSICAFCMNTGHDSLFSVNRLQSRCFDSSHTPINHTPGELIRTQDLDPVYEENSCLYIFNRDQFLRTRNRIGDNPLLFETPSAESIDIDTESDWDLATRLVR